MKCFLILTVFVSAFCADAATVPSNQEKVEVAQIDQVIHLVNKRELGSSHKRVSIIVLDHGMSSDVSPRFSVYLAFASLAEMGNLTTQFKITDEAFEFLSAARKSAGIYEIKTKEYHDEDGFTEVTYLVDSNQMFLDEQKNRTKCENDFCDQYFKSTISIKRSAQKTN